MKKNIIIITLLVIKKKSINGINKINKAKPFAFTQIEGEIDNSILKKELKENTLKKSNLNNEKQSIINEKKVGLNEILTFGEIKKVFIGVANTSQNYLNWFYNNLQNRDDFKKFLIFSIFAIAFIFFIYIKG